jgi:hypothetical protein
VIKQQRDEIANLKQQMFDSYTVYLSSEHIAPPLPSLESKALSTFPARKKKHFGEMSESVADDIDYDTDNDNYTSKESYVEEIKESIDDCDTDDDDNYCGLQNSTSASIKSEPDLDKMFITPQQSSTSSYNFPSSSSSSSSSSSFSSSSSSSPSFDETENIVNKINYSND